MFFSRFLVASFGFILLAPLRNKQINNNQPWVKDEGSAVEVEDVFVFYLLAIISIWNAFYPPAQVIR